MHRRAITWGNRVLIALTGVVLLIMADAISPVGVSFNHSISLPRGFYWNTPLRLPLRRGQLACFAYSAPVWAKPYHYIPENSLICKVVMGLPGDHISKIGDEVSICHEEKCVSAGLVRKSDTSGRLVTGALLPETIPESKVYMGATRVPNSFDSRYLGLIDQSNLVRQISPLLTE